MQKELKLLTLDEIEAEQVKWLWEPYIAFGKITLIQGDGGIGKSTMILAIIAEVTRGEEIGGSGVYTAPANAIYQTAEDGYSDTVKPRLVTLGADCKRVHIIDESDNSLTMSDERIERAILKSNAKLLILDPLQGFCHGSDMHSVRSMRPLMKHLGDVAERTKCAIVLVSHLNKRSGQSQYRGLGSIDIYAAARSVLTVGKLPNDENMRAMIHSKNNLAPLGKPQSFKLDENGIFCWCGDCDITIDEMLGGKPRQESQFTKARRLLESKLAHGAVPAVDIMQLAEDEGISFKTFKRAKDILGVISYKRGGKWYWEIPVEVVWAECSQEGQSEQGGQSTTLVPLVI